MLRRQLLAAFEAAALEYVAANAVAHALHKAMNSTAAAFFWLIGLL